MEQKAVNYKIILAGILSFIGLFIFFSIISFLIQGFSPDIHVLSRPGGFFYIAFNWVSFFIPVYLFVSAYFLSMKSFKREYLILQGLTVFPFLTLTSLTTLLIQDTIGISPIKDFFINTIGAIPGVIVFSLLLVLESLVIAKVYNSIFRKKGSGIKNKIKEYILSNLSVFESDKKDVKEKIKNFQLTGKEQNNNEYLHDKILKQRIKTEEYLEEKRHATHSKNALSFKSNNAIKNPISPIIQNIKKAAHKLQEQRDETQVFLEPEADEVSELTPTDTSAELSLEKHGILTVDLQTSEQDLEELECIEEPDEQVEQYENVLMLNTQKNISKNNPKDFKTKENFSPIKNNDYEIPLDELLHDYEDGEYWKIDTETKQYGEILMNTLMEFNISAELTGIRKGPVITMFEILPSPGVKLSKIVGLADNIALRLAASRVRIVAPIPGKQAVGIEIPNKKRSIVSFKELIALSIFKKSKYELPIILGKDISGEAQIIDLVQTPHLLIAGATGSGKSVCVNSLIASLLFKKTPEEVKLLLIDPKMVELKLYNDIPHLLTPVITETKHSFQALQYCLYEMERRYTLLDSIGVRDIRSFNKKIKEQKLATTKLPYIVIVIDEFADLLATTGKELEATISRLASMSRAVGIHLVLATQRPSVDVITGLIKANIPCRIAFMVASKFDSRIIIDSIGAEKLLGQGDMLFASAWDPVPIRIQGSFLSEKEVENVTEYLKTLGEPDYIDDEIFFEEEEENPYNSGSDDPLMEKALNIIVTSGKASTSYLQRRLKIGYNRAARLMEELEERGIVGPPNGSKPREILHVPALN